MTFNYRWNLSDGYPAAGVDKHGLKVMTTFACGGGSSMGYKLAGYDVVAANDIDPQMARVYTENHKPKQFFEMPVKDLINRDDLPKVDILDGSPPCSTFSTTGLREKAWGKNKKFREGQAVQVLDDLFFDFIELTDKMQPSVAVTENVKGMLIGNAKGYTRLIKQAFETIGYTCQVFLLNGATMGLPQARERVFFVAHKTEKKLQLKFDELPVYFTQISDNDDKSSNLTPLYRKYYREANRGESVGKFVSKRKLMFGRVPPTIVASSRNFHPNIPRELNDKETKLMGSYPLDYDFMEVDPNYLIGMSVPPLMMANVAHEIYEQLLRPEKLEDN